MRRRILAAAVVLGLGIVGGTLAQPAGEQQGQPAADRAKLRADVARLRAEVELLQLEHDADVGILKDWMSDMRNLELEASFKTPMKEEMSKYMRRSETGAPAREAPKMSDEEIEKALGPINLDQMTGQVVRPAFDRLRKEFVERGTELNVKRLELADLEKRFNEAR